MAEQVKERIAWQYKAKCSNCGCELAWVANNATHFIRALEVMIESHCPSLIVDCKECGLKTTFDLVSISRDD